MLETLLTTVSGLATGFLLVAVALLIWLAFVAVFVGLGTVFVLVFVADYSDPISRVKVRY